MNNLVERLQDPNERFSPQEMYHIFEAMAEQYGFHRDPNLPVKGAIVETTSLTVPKFEHWGVLIVRPRTQHDSLMGIPNLADKLLGDNFQPSQGTAFNAKLIALARTVIVSPVNIVERILRSEDEEDLNFFMAFGIEYKRWMDHRAAEIKAKKSGMTTGNESAS